VADELDAIVQGRSAQGRPIAVRTLAPGESPGDAHVLFVGSGARVAALAARARRGTLVVSEGEEALAGGGMIGFVQAEGRLRFVVALDAAERAGLRLNSRMLAVALYVQGGRQ
jgi:hypothetical protein